jgi:uncharacterized delta-60 repeat protein
VRRGFNAAALAIASLAIFAALAVALAAGDLDPSFSGDGVFTDPLGNGTQPGSAADAVAVQPDGKVVFAGVASNSETIVARLTADGSLDPAFGSGGKVLTAYGSAPGVIFPLAVALEPDGRILVGGTYTPNGGSQQPFVARWNTDGTPDGSFAGNGFFATQLGEGPAPHSGLGGLAVQPDGRIVLIGGATDSAGEGVVQLARLDTQGNLDPTFGTGGKLLAPQLGTGANKGSFATAGALQPDGKIVIAGQATDTNGAQADAALVARFDGDGKALDPTFGTGGKLVGRLGQSAPTITTVSALALQPDGKVVLGGQAVDGSSHQFALFSRLNADGQGLDPGFAAGGTLITQLGSGPTPHSRLLAVVVQPDGKIVGAGSGSGTGGEDAMVARLKVDGTLDAAFGNGGSVLQNLGGGVNSFFSGMALGPNGTVVPGGHIEKVVNGNVDVHALVARLITDLPPSVVFTAAPNRVDPGEAVAFNDSGSADPDGTITSYSWSFGDGTTATGSSATHSYATPGAYTAALTVRDDYGQTATSSQVITVNAPVVTPIAALGRPALSLLKIRPAKFAGAKRGGSIARNAGAVVSYRDSQAATTTFTVARAQPGRKSGGRCVKPTKRNARAKRCTRFVRVRGSFRHADTAGANSLRFTGRVSKKALRPGSYRLSATPRLGGKTGKTAAARFRIVP